MNKFRWVGLNKDSDVISIDSGLDTEDILSGNYMHFFRLENRGPNGNCEFLAEDRGSGIISANDSGEIYENDIVSTGEFKGIVKYGNYRVITDDWLVDHFVTGWFMEYEDGSGHVPIDSTFKKLDHIYNADVEKTSQDY